MGAQDLLGVQVAAKRAGDSGTQSADYPAQRAPGRDCGRRRFGLELSWISVASLRANS